MSVYTCAYVYTLNHTCVHTHVHIHTVCTCPYTYTCYTYTCSCTHTHTYINTCLQYKCGPPIKMWAFFFTDQVATSCCNEFVINANITLTSVPSCRAAMAGLAQSISLHFILLTRLRLTAGLFVARANSLFVARANSLSHLGPNLTQCCFVLLIPSLLPTPKVYGYRGFPQGSPDPNCFRLLLSLAKPGPSSSLQTTPEVPILLSEVQSGVLHLLGLMRGVRRGGKGFPFRPW